MCVFISVIRSSHLETKRLGIVLDLKLSFSDHINSLPKIIVPLNVPRKTKALEYCPLVWMFCNGDLKNKVHSHIRCTSKR